MNRLASANWGSILTSSEPSPEQYNPVADPNEYEDEPDEDLVSYIDFDDYDKFNLPKPDLTQ